MGSGYSRGVFGAEPVTQGNFYKQFFGVALALCASNLD